MRPLFLNILEKFVKCSFYRNLNSNQIKEILFLKMPLGMIMRNYSVDGPLV